MYIAPTPTVERALAALVKRQRDEDDRPPNAFESFFSQIFNPGQPETTTTTSRTRTRGGDDDDEDETSTTSSTTSSTTRTSSSSTTSTTSSTTSSSTLSSTSSTSTTTSSTPSPEPPATSPRTSDSKTVVVVTETDGAPPPTKSSDSSNNDDSATSQGLSPTVIGIIVAASVIFGLIFLALITRKIFQMRRKTRRNTWNAPFEPELNPPVNFEKPPASYSAPSRNLGSVDAGYGAAGAAGLAAGYGGANAYEKPLPPVTYPNATFAYPGGGPPGPPPSGYAPYQYNAPPMAAMGPPPVAYNAPSPAPQYNFSPADMAGAVPIVRTPSPPTQISVVRRTFTPTMPDELSIVTGESVRVLAAYDDGWCKAQRLNGQEEGMVPLECLEDPGQPPAFEEANSTSLKRASSLVDRK